MRRTPYHILYDILNLCMNPVLKTRIVYQCNLNFKIIQKYLSLLIEKEYLNVIEQRTRNQYVTTQKGLDFMTMLNPIFTVSNIIKIN